MNILQALGKAREGAAKESEINVLPFFDALFIGTFLRRVEEKYVVSADWRKKDMTPNVGAGLYLIAVEVLWEEALRAHSETHPNVFQEATVISGALCTILNEGLRLEMEPKVIVSPTELLVAAGLAEVRKGMDDKEYVFPKEKTEP